jgi:hypothetical protein
MGYAVNISAHLHPGAAELGTAVMVRVLKPFMTINLLGQRSDLMIFPNRERTCTIKTALAIYFRWLVCLQFIHSLKVFAG